MSRQNVLYHNAESVTDELFQTEDFFDPHDLMQVKYEMLRRVRTDSWSVTRAADTFGFSRISYYAIRTLIRRPHPTRLRSEEFL